MKKSKPESAYQKMLLVTPMVYQKLLNCIDEKDKLLTEELNAPKFGGTIKTPSEKLLEQISSKDVGIQVAPETSEFGIQVPSETSPIHHPQMVSMETETDPMQIGFTQTETERQIPMSTQTEQIPLVPQTETLSNPLTNSCPQDTDQGSIIPTLFYRPSFKTKRVSKINKQQLQSTLKQLEHKPTPPTLPLEYNPDPSLHTIPLQQQDIRSVRQLPSFEPKTLRKEKFDFTTIGGVKKSTFPCSICGNTFTRKHDLKRHLASPTVHKHLNLKSTITPTQPINLPPNPNFPPEPELPPETFDFWDDGYPPPESRPKGKLVKRSNVPLAMDINKPTVLGKRTHGKAKLGNLRYPTKLRRGEETSEEEFTKW